MACFDRLSQWEKEVSTAFAHLSRPQLGGLMQWSAGIALTGSAGMCQISALLAQVLNQAEASVFQRLREWYPYLEPEKREETERGGGQHLFCSLAALGSALVGERRETLVARGGCHEFRQSLDGAGGKRGAQRRGHSGGVESAASRSRRVVASALGAAVCRPAGSHSLRLVRACAG